MTGITSASALDSPFTLQLLSWKSSKAVSENTDGESDGLGRAKTSPNLTAKIQTPTSGSIKYCFRRMPAFPGLLSNMNPENAS